MAKENVIVSKSFEFSLEIIELYKFLKNNNEFVLSKQVLRSGTSIGANVEEAVGGFSKKDFTAKMGIALKEARETRYWLKLLDKSQIVKCELSTQMKMAEELVSILTAIVKTSQGN